MNCIMVMYDVTNAESYEIANQWINDIKKMMSNQVAIILAGNKIDIAHKN